MGDLLAAERDEAALVWQAQAQGLPVEHRADISPLAILQVRLVTTPRADAAETSPGYSWPLRRFPVRKPATVKLTHYPARAAFDGWHRCTLARKGKRQAC